MWGEETDLLQDTREVSLGQRVAVRPRGKSAVINPTGPGFVPQAGEREASVVWWIANLRLWPCADGSPLREAVVGEQSDQDNQERPHPPVVRKRHQRS